MSKPPATKDALLKPDHGGTRYPPQTSCSSEYHIDGGDLWIIIDTTHFRVHSSFFVKGTSFFTSFLDPGQKLDQNALPGVGRSENAIIIRIATIKEFERFCWVFYNDKFDDYSEATVEEWFTILRLAHTWGFEIVKAMALRYIKQKEHEIPNVVDRIVMYEKYSPPVETLLPLYVDLCQREEYPTDEECEKLGDAKAVKIYRTREKLLRAAKKASSGKIGLAEFTAIVAESLGLKSDVPKTGKTTGAARPESQQAGPTTPSGTPTNKQANKVDGGDAKASLKLDVKTFPWSKSG
ncbi:hypothetical protein NMY22_g5638 [Coprinellus aureogranulatus]|nr:hypothetical protein NMY22_g5638 [Coprinellus aureogranulatus]